MTESTGPTPCNCTQPYWWRRRALQRLSLLLIVSGMSKPSVGDAVVRHPSVSQLAAPASDNIHWKALTGIISTSIQQQQHLRLFEPSENLVPQLSLEPSVLSFQHEEGAYTVSLKPAVMLAFPEVAPGDSLKRDRTALGAASALGNTAIRSMAGDVCLWSNGTSGKGYRSRAFAGSVTTVSDQDDRMYGTLAKADIGLSSTICHVSKTGQLSLSKSGHESSLIRTPRCMQKDYSSNDIEGEGFDDEFSSTRGALTADSCSGCSSTDYRDDDSGSGEAKSTKSGIGDFSNPNCGAGAAENGCRNTEVSSDARNRSGRCSVNVILRSSIPSPIYLLLLLLRAPSCGGLGMLSSVAILLSLSIVWTISSVGPKAVGWLPNRRPLDRALESARRAAGVVRVASELIAGSNAKKTRPTSEHPYTASHHVRRFRAQLLAVAASVSQLTAASSLPHLDTRLVGGLTITPQVGKRGADGPHPEMSRGGDGYGGGVGGGGGGASVRDAKSAAAEASPGIGGCHDRQREPTIMRKPRLVNTAADPMEACGNLPAAGETAIAAAVVISSTATAIPTAAGKVETKAALCDDEDDEFALGRPAPCPRQLLGNGQDGASEPSLPCSRQSSPSISQFRNSTFLESTGPRVQGLISSKERAVAPTMEVRAVPTATVPTAVRLSWPQMLLTLPSTGEKAAVPEEKAPGAQHILLPELATAVAVTEEVTLSVEPLPPPPPPTLHQSRMTMRQRLQQLSPPMELISGNGFSIPACNLPLHPQHLPPPPPRPNLSQLLLPLPQHLKSQLLSPRQQLQPLSQQSEQQPKLQPWLPTSPATKQLASATAIATASVAAATATAAAASQPAVAALPLPMLLLPSVRRAPLEGKVITDYDPSIQTCGGERVGQMRRNVTVISDRTAVPAAVQTAVMDVPLDLQGGEIGGNGGGPAMPVSGKRPPPWQLPSPVASQMTLQPSQPLSLTSQLFNEPKAPTASTSSASQMRALLSRQPPPSPGGLTTPKTHQPLHPLSPSPSGLKVPPPPPPPPQSRISCPQSQFPGAARLLATSGVRLRRPASSVEATVSAAADAAIASMTAAGTESAGRCRAEPSGRAPTAINAPRTTLKQKDPWVRDQAVPTSVLSALRSPLAPPSPSVASHPYVFEGPKAIVNPPPFSKHKPPPPPLRPLRPRSSDMSQSTASPVLPSSLPSTAACNGCYSRRGGGGFVSPLARRMEDLMEDSPPKEPKGPASCRTSVRVSSGQRDLPLDLLMAAHQAADLAMRRRGAHIPKPAVVSSAAAVACAAAVEEERAEAPAASALPLPTPYLVRATRATADVSSVAETNLVEDDMGPVPAVARARARAGQASSVPPVAASIAATNTASQTAVKTSVEAPRVSATITLPGLATVPFGDRNYGAAAAAVAAVWPLTSAVSTDMMTTAAVTAAAALRSGNPPIGMIGRTVEPNLTCWTSNKSQCAVAATTSSSGTRHTYLYGQAATTASGIASGFGTTRVSSEGPSESLQSSWAVGRSMGQLPSCFKSPPSGQVSPLLGHLPQLYGMSPMNPSTAAAMTSVAASESCTVSAGMVMEAADVDAVATSGNLLLTRTGVNSVVRDYPRRASDATLANSVDSSNSPRQLLSVSSEYSSRGGHGNYDHGEYGSYEFADSIHNSDVHGTFADLQVSDVSADCVFDDDAESCFVCMERRSQLAFAHPSGVLHVGICRDCLPLLEACGWSTTCPICRQEVTDMRDLSGRRGYDGEERYHAP